MIPSDSLILIVFQDSLRIRGTCALLILNTSPSIGNPSPCSGLRPGCLYNRKKVADGGSRTRTLPVLLPVSLPLRNRRHNVRMAVSLGDVNPDRSVIVSLLLALWPAPAVRLASA